MMGASYPSKKALKERVVGRITEDRRLDSRQLPHSRVVIVAEHVGLKPLGKGEKQV